MTMPPGFGFPPGMAPPPGTTGYPPGMAPPGLGSAPGMAPPGTSQANMAQRPGVPSFVPPSNLPNINFNAPIIRLGTSATKSQPLPGSNSNAAATPLPSNNSSNTKNAALQNANASNSRD